MEISSTTAPNTATTAPTPTKAETDTYRDVRLTFEVTQKNPDLKLWINV
jgi:hypothetical protein